jgi:hypothetical protein
MPLFRKPIPTLATANEGYLRYRQRLERCRTETPRQTSPKASGESPRRKPHKAPTPPTFFTMRDDHNVLLQQHIGAA